MTNRMLIIICAALVCVGPILAQPPAETPPVPMPPVTDGQAPAEAPPATAPMSPAADGQAPAEAPPATATATSPTGVQTQDGYLVSPSIWGYAFPGGDGRFWITGDYLLGYVKAGAVPPLVTTSPSVTTARTSAGVLGLSTTSILFDGTVTDDMRSGFRFGTGYWFDHERTLGIDAGFSVLESQSTIFGR